MWKDCQESMTHHYNSYSHDTQVLLVSVVIQSLECVSKLGPCQFASIHTSSFWQHYRPRNVSASLHSREIKQSNRADCYKEFRDNNTLYDFENSHVHHIDTYV